MGQFGGAKYWRGVYHPTWPSLKTAIMGAGMNPDQWLQTHPDAASAYGIAAPSSNTGMPPTGTSSTTSVATSTATTTGAPVGSSIPGAGIYGMAQNQAQLAYEQALGAVNQRQQDVFGQYGLQGDVDPTTGAISNVKQDPTSVYGQIPMLQRQAGQTIERLEEATASRNIGGEGIASRPEAEARYQFGANYNTAFGGFRNSMQEAALARQQASGNLQQANLDILLSSVQNALSNQQFTPADVSSLLTENSSVTSSVAGGGAGGAAGAKAAKTGPFQWGGKTMVTRGDMTRFLRARGASVEAFKQKNPALWKRLKPTMNPSVAA